MATPILYKDATLVSETKVIITIKVSLTPDGQPLPRYEAWVESRYRGETFHDEVISELSRAGNYRLESLKSSGSDFDIDIERKYYIKYAKKIAGLYDTRSLRVHSDQVNMLTYQTQSGDGNTGSLEEEAKHSWEEIEQDIDEEEWIKIQSSADR